MENDPTLNDFKHNKSSRLIELKRINVVPNEGVGVGIFEDCRKLGTCLPTLT